MLAAAMPRLLAVASLAAALVASPARAGWSWLSPTPTGYPIESAAFPTASRGYLVGGAGTILASTDGGARWTLESAPSSADLYGVFFLPDGATGWAVGGNGTILHTTDGVHWSAQTSPTAQKLYAVAFVDALHGFVAGDQRTLLQTADGGQSWTLRDGQILTLNALVFADALHGFAAGWGGTVLLTLDGGQSWSPIETPTTEDLLALSFADASHGWAVGAGGAIVATTDGGRSWHAQAAGLTSQDLVGVFAATSGVAYAVGNGGSFWFTTDGSTWQAGGWADAGEVLTGLAASPTGALVALGADGHIYSAPPTTAPGSQIFSDENQGFSRYESVTGIAFADALHGVLVAGGVLYYTQDGGAHLQPGSIPPSSQPSRPFVAWQAVSMPAPSAVFAVGTGGGIAVSHDVGQSWSWLSDQGGFPEADLFAVAFADGQVGYAAGEQGMVLSTRDGGGSWSPEPTPAAGTLHALLVLSPNEAVAVGDYGEIVGTTDGRSWSLAAIPPGSQALRGISGRPPGHIYAVGDRGATLVSLDQGQTWYAQPSIADADLGPIVMLDRLNGFLATSHPGQILVTRDGAQSWQPQIGALPPLAALAFVDPQHGFAGGVGGSLLGTDTGGEASCVSSADCADAGAENGLGYACVRGACAPCNLDSQCTAACSACGAPTPYCLGGFCGQCLLDSDCADGGSCISGGCVVNSPLPDAGLPFADGGFTGFDAGFVVVLPDGGVRLNPQALCCGCRPGGDGSSPLGPLILGGFLFVSLFLHRRRAGR